MDRRRGSSGPMILAGKGLAFVRDWEEPEAQDVSEQ